MATDSAGILDEAYERLHQTGPEYEGWLSNHGPMAAEAMARHGHAENVGPWLDRYVKRLEEFPRGSGAIGPDWQEALGDPRRIADWTVFFRHESATAPWREVLGTWWPRLLPGAVAAATHGIIRTGHAVRALLADGEDPAHITELAHGLAYWAARWQPIPGAGKPARPRQDAASVLTPAAALATVPRIGDQSGGIRDRLARLDGLTGWQAALSAPTVQEAAQARTWLTGLVDAAVITYLDHAHGNPTMLVHAATAPTAVLRVLPALDEDLWALSAAAAWDATAALVAIYAPAEPAPPQTRPAPPTGPGAVEEVFARAVVHGDEHVIKFVDTAADVHARTGDPAALAAGLRAIDRIPRPA
jgi:hypothetical protein